MSDAWDPSLVDPTKQPRDVSMIRSPGGRSGALSLENGAKLAFPWARQQKISGTYPGQVYVVDDASTEYIYMQSPTLVSGGHRAQLYLAGWDDGTSSIGMAVNGGVTFTLASGQIYTSAHPFTANGTFTAAGAATFQSTVNITGTLSVAALTASGAITANGGINASSAGGVIDLRGSSGTNVVVASHSTRTAVFQGGTNVELSATAGSASVIGTGAVIVNSTGSTSTVASSAGTTISAASAAANVTLTHGSSGFADVNSRLRILNTTNISSLGQTSMGLSIGSKTGLELMLSPNYIQTQNNGANSVLALNTLGGSVQANGYPIVPLRQIGSAYLGTPPSVSATDPRFVMQTGQEFIAFTSGIGRLTFPNSFSTGLMSVLVNVRHDGDGFVQPRSSGTHNTSGVDLTLTQAGGFPTGSYYINWLAIGY